MSRTFYPVHSAADLGSRPIVPSNFNEVIAGGMIGWVLEADLKDFIRRPTASWWLEGTSKSPTRAR
jgi:hypothetical protein